MLTDRCLTHFHHSIPQKKASVGSPTPPISQLLPSLHGCWRPMFGYLRSKFDVEFELGVKSALRRATDKQVSTRPHHVQVLPSLLTQTRVGPSSLDMLDPNSMLSSSTVSGRGRVCATTYYQQHVSSRMRRVTQFLPSLLTETGVGPSSLDMLDTNSTLSPSTVSGLVEVRYEVLSTNKSRAISGELRNFGHRF